MQSIAIRAARAFGNPEAWVLIILGILLFSLRTPLETYGPMNVPVAATVIQTAGLMFAIFGFQIMASIFMWPSLDLGVAITEACKGNTGAGLIVLGLLLFNGLSMVAFSNWVTGSLGMALGGK